MTFRLSLRAFFSSVLLLLSCGETIRPSNDSKPAREPVVPCEQGTFLCHGVCTPVGACTARELAFNAATRTTLAPFDEDSKKRDLSGFFPLDFDQDGKPDIVYATCATGANFYRDSVGFKLAVVLGLGGCAFDADHQITLLQSPAGEHGGFRRIFKADLNNDGFPDILVEQVRHPSSPQEEVFAAIYLLFLEAGKVKKQVLLTGEQLGIKPLKRVYPPSDLDGNGTLDILVMSDGAPGNLHALMLSSSGEVASVTPGINYDRVVQGDVAIFDLNGDKRSEILTQQKSKPTTFYSWGGYAWFSGVASIMVDNQSTPISEYELISLDFDADGRMDIIQKDNSFLNLGNGFYQNVGKVEEYPFPLAFEDMDLDGNIDIWGGGGLSFGNGMGNFSTPYAVYDAQDQSPSGIPLDLTGDGAPDIVGVNGAGVGIMCHENVGKPILK